MWSLLWLFKVFRLVNRLLQKSQANFRLPSCISLWSWIFIFYTFGYPRAYPSGPEYSYFILPVTLVHIPVVLNIYILYFRLPSCISLSCGPEYLYFILPVTLVHSPVVLNIHILYFRLPSCIFLWYWIFIFYTSGFPRARALPNFLNITIFAQTLQHLHKHCHIFTNITILEQTLPHLHTLPHFYKKYHICTNITTFAQTLQHLNKHCHIFTKITTFAQTLPHLNKHYHICTNITIFEQTLPHLHKNYHICTNISTFAQTLQHLNKHYHICTNITWNDPIQLNPFPHWSHTYGFSPEECWKSINQNPPFNQEIRI